MTPNKELQDLAAALRKTPEYEHMMNRRKLLMTKYRQMMTGFEREHSQLYRQRMPEADMLMRLKALYAKYKDFLEQEDVRSFLEAARSYQKLVSDSISYLNKLLETDGPGRLF